VENRNQLKSPTIYIQVTVAALLYNLLHILAWELPLAVRLDWRIHVIGDVFIISVAIISIVLISGGKKRANIRDDTGSMGDFVSMVLSLYHLGL
jgi:hypothetical protein